MAECIMPNNYQFGGDGGGGGSRMDTSSPSEENRKLFLGGLSWETEESDLLHYFSKFGEVQNINIKYDNLTRRSRGFAFVTFANTDTVEAVLNGGPHVIKNRTVEPKRPKGKSGSKKIFVGGINGDMSKEDIKAYFQQFGNIENIERPFDRQRNRSRDFCFVIFETEEAAENAIASPKQVIGGKECDIKLAHPQRNNNRHNGGGMNGGMGGHRRGPPMGGGGGDDFFKMRNGNQPMNWRGNDRSGGGGGGGGFRGNNHRYPDTQFLTNIDTVPPNNDYYF